MGPDVDGDDDDGGHAVTAGHNCVGIALLAGANVRHHLISGAML